MERNLCSPVPASIKCCRFPAIALPFPHLPQLPFQPQKKANQSKLLIRVASVLMHSPPVLASGASCSVISLFLHCLLMCEFNGYPLIPAMIQEQNRVFCASHIAACVCCSADVVLNATNIDNFHLLFPHWCSLFHRTHDALTTAPQTGSITHLKANPCASRIF